MDKIKNAMILDEDPTFVLEFIAENVPKEYENPKADMTPMIDVVFQLMIFFLVTIKQEDIFSKLNANRPAPNSSA